MPHRKVSSSELIVSRTGLSQPAYSAANALSSPGADQDSSDSVSVGTKDEGHPVDQPPARAWIKQEAPGGSEPERGVLEIVGPRQPLGGNQFPVGHDSF